MVVEMGREAPKTTEVLVFEGDLNEALRTVNDAPEGKDRDSYMDRAEFMLRKAGKELAKVLKQNKEGESYRAIVCGKEVVYRPMFGTDYDKRFNPKQNPRTKVQYHDSSFDEQVKALFPEDQEWMSAYVAREAADAMGEYREEEPIELPIEE